LAATLLKLAAFYRAVMRHYRGEEAASIEALRTDVSDAIRKNADLLQYALQEAFGPLKERESLAMRVRQVERVFRAVELLEFAVRDGSPDAYLRNDEPYFRNFNASLEQLEEGLAGTLQTLSESVAAESLAAERAASGKLLPGWPNVNAAIASLEEQAAQARKAGATARYPLDEILRFYYLLLSSRNLAGEVELLCELVADPRPVKTN
jgi:hypothetical protein